MKPRNRRTSAEVVIALGYQLAVEIQSRPEVSEIAGRNKSCTTTRQIDEILGGYSYFVGLKAQKITGILASSIS